MDASDSGLGLERTARLVRRVGQARIARPMHTTSSANQNEPTTSNPTPTAVVDTPTAAPAAAAAASAPAPNTLPVSLLLARLSSGVGWSPAQVGVLIDHILHAHSLLPPSSSSDAPFVPSPHVRVALPTSPLASDDFETLLTAAAQSGLFERFQAVWTIMAEQLPRAAGNKPTEVMHLCRISLLLGQRRYTEVPPAFDEYRRDQAPRPPQLAAYHLLMQAHIGLQTDAGTKCMQVWQQMKLAAATSTAGEEPEEAAAASSAAASVAEKRGSSFKPVRSTFHYLLRALQIHMADAHAPAAGGGAASAAAGSARDVSAALAGASYALSQVTPIQLEMAHQFDLEPDWTTYTMVLHVLQRVIEVCTSTNTAAAAATDAANARRKEEMVKQAWTKYEQAWRAVEATKAKQDAAFVAAQQQQQQNEAKTTIDAFSSSPSSSSSPSTRVAASPPPLPASLLLARLSLALSARRPDELFLVLHSVRQLGLVPGWRECLRVMDVCEEVARREVPRSTPTTPPTAATPPPALTPEQRAHLRLQQQAADASLQMLRCIRTHQALEAKKAMATPPTPSPSDPAASSSAPAAPTSTPPVLSLRHFLAAYSCQSRALRFSACARLFAHLRAERQGEGAEARREMAAAAVDRLVRETLTLEVLEVADEEEQEDRTTNSSRRTADSESALSENAGAAVDLAYSMVQFFAGAASAATPADLAALQPIVAMLAKPTRMMLLQSLLAANRTEEVTHLLEATKLADREAARDRAKATPRAVAGK